MKMTYLAKLCGLNTRTATEQQIANALESMATRANVAGEGPGSSKSSPYQWAGLGRASTPDFAIVPTRPGFWTLYARKSDGSYAPVGQETANLDALTREIAKRQHAKSSKANEIQTLVTAEMANVECDYTTAFANVKRTRPDLFANMVDPAPAQKEAHLPRRR